MQEPQPPLDPMDDDVSQQAPGLRLGRVFGGVVSVMIVIGLGFLGYEYWANREIAYAKVTGRVMWNGKPITIGAVMTRHTRYEKEAAIGAFDKDGKFELSSNGRPGAAIGTHKVIVASYGAGMGTTPLVPAPYLKATTTPLSIEVTGDPSKNHFELEIVGDEPKTNSSPGGGGRPGGDGAEAAAAEPPTPPANADNAVPEAAAPAQ